MTSRDGIRVFFSAQSSGTKILFLGGKMKLARYFLPLLVCLAGVENAAATEIRLEGGKEFFLKGGFDDESVEVIKKCARTIAK